MEQRILYDFYKEIEVPANKEIELDFKSNNEINQFLPFKNGFIFNLENKRIKFYVNRRDNPRILIESGFVELNNSDLIHLKIKNDNETSHKIIITCNNDYTELELLSILAGIKKWKWVF